jgi:outer membrane protein OmpA-like peptidoglycan-associated protein
MPIRPLCAALGAALALSACTDPSTAGNPTPRTRDGAIAGAIVGTAVGLATGSPQNRARNAAVGAAFGAAVGGAIGSRLDRQAQALDQSLDDRITVTNTGSALVVTLPQDIVFDVNSAELRPDLRADLRTLAASLQEYPDSTVDVIGHTDNTGTAVLNQDLSSRRASAVAGELIAAGVSSARLRTIGRGENAPIATNLTPEGRAQNRRVEIVINPTTS